VDHVIHVPLPTFTFQRSAGLQKMLKTLLGKARAIHCDDREGKSATLGCVSWEPLLSNCGTASSNQSWMAWLSQLLGTCHASFGVRLAHSCSFLSMQLVSMMLSIRNLGTQYPTSSSHHTFLLSAFLRRRPITTWHLVAISASSPFASHPQMAYPDFQVWPPNWNTSGR